MQSMTGFSTQSFSTSEVNCEITIKSVNNRYLDLRFHLPRHYSSLEVKLRKIAKSFLIRGTVDIYINRNSMSSQVSLDSLAVSNYYKQILKLSKKLGLKSQDSIDTLVGVLPLVPVQKDSFDLGTKEQNLLIKNFKLACEACCKQRSLEAQALKKDILTYLKKLNKNLKTIISEKNSINKVIKEKMLSRITELIDNKSVEISDSRLSQEVYFFLDKQDINEEIVRLEEHINKASAFVETKGPHGKKLDFWCQELLREVNTIGSKSSSSAIAQKIIDSKLLVENLREQVQNIQ